MIHVKLRHFFWNIQRFFLSLQKSGKCYINDLLFISNKIPGADTAAIAAISTAALTNGGRVCGRALSSVTDLLTTTTAGTVCGKSAM